MSRGIIYFAKRHFGATQIIFGCAMFPTALSLLGYQERLLNSYGVFDDSLSGRFDSFVYNTVGLQPLSFASAGMVLAGIIFIATGIWSAATPPVPKR